MKEGILILNNNLQLFNFKGNDFTVFMIDEKPYWIAKEICEELDIKNFSDATNKLKEGSQKKKLSYDECRQIGLTDLQEVQIGTKGLVLLSESGIFRLAFKSEKPSAEEFTDWLSEEVLPAIRANGKYDIIESQIKQIEDETERNFKLSIYAYEQILKVNSNDLLTSINMTQTKQKLDTYLQKKELEKVKEEVKQLSKQSEQVKKATVLREGDMSAEAVAKKFNIFSINNNPHNQFANYLAKDLGFYINPEGNAGYQDDYISVNLENKGGQTRAVIKYSIKAVKEMEEYIEENGLKFEEPPKYYVKGIKKGQFNYTYLLFEKDERIKINELTYKLYTKNNEE